MKKILSIFTVVILLLTSITLPAYALVPVDELQFDTSIASWAKNEVSNAIESDLIPAELQNHYNVAITRDEFCELAIHLIEVNRGMSIEKFMLIKGLIMAEESPFTDTDSRSARAAYTLGITNGTSLTTFSPDKELTREQASKFLSLTAQLLGEDIDIQGDTYSDDVNIAGWAKPYVGYLNNKSIMKGVGGDRFAPKDSYQRQQAFMTMLRLYNVVEGYEAVEEIDTMFMGQDFSNPDLADLLTVMRNTFEHAPLTMDIEDANGMDIELYYLADESGFVTTTKTQYKDFNDDDVDVIEFYDGEYFITMAPSLEKYSTYQESVDDKKWFDFGTRTEFVGKVVDGTFVTYTFRDLGIVDLRGLPRYYDYELNMAYNNITNIRIYNKENDDSEMVDYGTSYSMDIGGYGYSNMDQIPDNYTVVDGGPFYDGESYPFWYMPAE